MKRYYGVDFELQREKLLKSEKARFMIDDVINGADEVLEKEYPALKISDYMLFQKNGNREIFQKGYFERRNDCSRLSIAYWLTRDDKYLEKLKDMIFMICDEYTWCIPAHTELTTKNPTVEIIIETVDLFSAETARLLTDIMASVGDSLPEYVWERVEYELRRRVILPMTKYNFFWFDVTYNWASVCAGGVGVALLHFGTDEEKEKILPIIYNCMENFLNGYGNDGCCIEGMAYWNYGFGYFTIFARAILDYTDGKVNYFERDKVKKIAIFAQNVRMGSEKVVCFSDAVQEYYFSPGLVSFLKSVYEDVALPDISLANPEGNVFSIKELLWYDCDYCEDEPKESVTYYEDAEWYINHSKEFSFAAKGGHNNEFHNHNDIGSFMIVTNDNKTPLTDLGRGVYNKFTFSPEHRFKMLVNSSRGHSVPIINGQYQCEGKEYFAKNVSYSDNHFELDMENAYENGLVEKIHRRFDIGDDFVKFSDTFTYSEKTESVVERMISQIEPELYDGCVMIDGTKVMFDSERYSVSLSFEDYRNTNDDGEDRAYLIDFVPLNNRETEFVFDIKI